MSKELIESILPVNCANNYKEENRTGQCKCYSTTCMLNANDEVAQNISKNGCIIYKTESVQSIINLFND
jgi:hypothetical protein